MLYRQFHMDLCEITFRFQIECQEEMISRRRAVEKIQGGYQQSDMIGRWISTNENPSVVQCLLAQSNYLSKMKSAALCDFLSGIAGKY